MLQFDESGHIQPAHAHLMNLQQVEILFVDAFPTSVTRPRLFNNFLQYIDRFQDEVFPYFEQWIDGSFVTQKLNPKDIDMVTFLDYRIWEKRSDTILDSFWSFSLENEGIDAYLVAVYPENHRHYPIYLSERALWRERFSSDRDSYKKGFVELQFQKN